MRIIRGTMYGKRLLWAGALAILSVVSQESFAQATPTPTPPISLPCTGLVASPASFNVPNTTSVNTIQATGFTNNPCIWHATVVGSAWITIKTQNGGTSQNPGNGNVSFQVEANRDLVSRSNEVDIIQTNGGPPTQVPIVQAAGPGGFTISVNRLSQDVAPGINAFYTVTMTPSGGFTGCVGLSASSGLPGITFTPVSVCPNTPNSTMTVPVAFSACPGTNQIAISGTNTSPGGNGVVTAPQIQTTLNVVGDFSLSVNPASLGVVQGTSNSSSVVTITDSQGYSNAVQLSASGQPGLQHVTILFSPTTTAGSSAITISADQTTPIGTYPITINGSGGCLSRSTIVSLTISPSWWPAIQQILDE